jgi:hypothetical protein
MNKVKVKVILRPTVSRLICLGTKHPFGAYDQTLIIVWQLRVCWFGSPSVTSERVCRLQLLLVLASAVIFGSESRRTHGHILLSQIRDFPSRRLLRLARSWWRYSTPPPHGWEDEQFLLKISKEEEICRCLHAAFRKYETTFVCKTCESLSFN